MKIAPLVLCVFWDLNCFDIDRTVFIQLVLQIVNDLITT